MIKYYGKEDYYKAKKRRNLLLAVFLAITAAYAAASVALLVYYIFLPYHSPMIATVKAVHYPLTAVYVIFAFVYLGTVYKKAQKMFRFMQNIEKGLKEVSEANFFEYDETPQVKDGVDVKSLIFLEWNEIKQDYFERKVLVFYDRPFPEIPLSATVKFITHGNFLLEYQILEEKEQQNESDSNCNR